jgi:uncharacterized protein YndB with AHSA1/START domain
MTDLVATAETDIAAPPERVWDALTDPAKIKQYMFGSTVETDWQTDSSITWSGEFDGKPYQDKGTVLEVDEPRRLVVTHFSPLSGQDDVPENYHTLTYELDARGDSTHVSLSQDHNGSEDEAAHSRDNWAMVLTGLKGVVEKA